MSRSRIFVQIIVVLALTVAGLAYVSPRFASGCKAVYEPCAAWCRRQSEAVKRAYEKTPLYASIQKELKAREAAKRTNAAQSRAKETKSLPTSAANPKPLTEAQRRQQERANWSVGQKIAHSRAFAKHKDDFGFKTEDQMASHIDRVISFASASNTKQLSRGRTAYWDERTRSIVIVDPRSADGGTVFKPQQGKPYFNNLK